MLNKNDEIELKIEDLSRDGEGIGHTKDGMTVFVMNGVPGDLVLAHVTKVKKTYAYAFTKEILKASGDRVEPKCPVARLCGGCSLQHLEYSAQLKFKEEYVRNCIERIGGIKNPPMEPIVGMEEPFFFRNKAQFPIGVDRDGKVVIGFFRHHSHDVVDNASCVIQGTFNEKIVEAVKRYIETYKVSVYDEATGKGLMRHVFTRFGKATGEVMVCFVVNGDKLPESDALVDILKSLDLGGLTIKSICINVNKAKTNVILGDKLISLYGDPWIEDLIGDVRYRISPLSFYQVNPGQTKKLYDLALSYAGLTGKEIVWDLYCGIGTISLFLAKAAKEVYGVEIVPEAIDDAKLNAKLNGIENAEFFVGAAEDVAPKLKKPDVIVVDPPRKGCDEKLLDTIITMAPKRLVYVSCDPATLARDLKILTENGFELVKARPVDQFGHSTHCEVCCELKLRADNEMEQYKHE
ncbi:MAG: 23S rRNA (uracil(1939)-C(5))-methyltransferase RlmD [Lachnospiraceae bacterium]|nr:23S rRNA (uracil(1939)-C(5))-methyltransferase RlmD [Lachnospiraceae bacterium]